MEEYESLSHTTWDCKIMLFSFRNVDARRCIKSCDGIWAKCSASSRSEEGHLMPDHVHMLLSIPPKYAVSQVVGFIKGKSAIRVARVYGERRRNFVGQHFWARGFFVNTVGRDEEAIRAYIRNQENEDQRLVELPRFDRRVGA